MNCTKASSKSSLCARETCGYRSSLVLQYCRSACGMLGGKGVACIAKRKHQSSDPPAATTWCRLLLFDLSLYKLHPLAQKFHHHVQGVVHNLISITPDALLIAYSILPQLTRGRRARSLYLSPIRHIFASIGSATASYLLGSSSEHVAFLIGLVPAAHSCRIQAMVT